jgi:hypothetical protein
VAEALGGRWASKLQALQDPSEGSSAVAAGASVREREEEEARAQAASAEQEPAALQQVLIPEDVSVAGLARLLGASGHERDCTDKKTQCRHIMQCRVPALPRMPVCVLGGCSPGATTHCQALWSTLKDVSMSCAREQRAVLCGTACSEWVNSLFVCYLPALKPVWWAAARRGGGGCSGGLPGRAG